MKSALQQAIEKVGGFFSQLLGGGFSGGDDRPKPTPTPRPGYKYIEGTNITAPLDSDLHPENRTRTKVKSSTSRAKLKPTVTPTPTVAQAVEAIEDIVRGRAPINMATLGSEAKNALPDLDKAIAQATERFPVNKDLLYDIAFAESSWNPKTINEIGASGWYQFTPGTWKDVLKYSNDPNSSLYGVLPSTDVMDPYANTMAAAYLINKGQLGKWDASEWNWGGRYDLSKEIEEPGYYSQSTYHIPGVRPSIRLGKY